MREQNLTPNVLATGRNLDSLVFQSWRENEIAKIVVDELRKFVKKIVGGLQLFGIIYRREEVNRHISCVLIGQNYQSPTIGEARYQWH